MSADDRRRFGLAEHNAKRCCSSALGSAAVSCNGLALMAVINKSYEDISAAQRLRISGSHLPLG